jgi:hypothetical protein
MMKDMMRKVYDAIRKMPYAIKGVISVNHPSSHSVSVESANEIRQIPLISPWGLKGNPPPGTRVQVLLNWAKGEEATVAGVVTDEGPVIEPGECAMWHEQGMVLILKNDGTVHLYWNHGEADQREVIKMDNLGELYLQGRRVQKSTEANVGSEI